MKTSVLEALVYVLRAYVKVRAIVRLARQESWSIASLVSRLMLSVGRNETDYLHRIASSFYTKNECITKKRETIGWGNARKIYDRLHRLLASEGKRWKMKVESSKNYWYQEYLRRLLLECFRARAIAHTSARYNG